MNSSGNLLDLFALPGFTRSVCDVALDFFDKAVDDVTRFGRFKPLTMLPLDLK
jgi:hypothetical protein